MKRFSVSELMLSLLSILGFLVLLEWGASFLNQRLSLRHAYISNGVGGKDVLEYPAGYLKDRELFWKLDPQQKGYNSLGFRDREFALFKDHNVFRIICMGDSVTFGWPSDIELTYPKVLEQLLRQHSSRVRFEVFNAGVPGYTSYQGLLWFKKTISHCNPDLVVAYFGINDESQAHTPDQEERLSPEFIVRCANVLRKFQLYQLMSKIALYFKYPPSKEKLYTLHRVSPKEYRSNIEEMLEIAKANGIKMLFLVRPAFYDPAAKSIFSNGYLPPENILGFNVYDCFKKIEKDAEGLFLDDIRPLNFHLTTGGHRALAEALFVFLTERNIIGREEIGSDGSSVKESLQQ